MAAATAGGGGGLRSPALHVGDGTVRRAAYHDARTAQIRALESGALAAQRPLLPVVTVPAASVVVDEDGPNYRPPLKREPKKQRKQRRYAKALRVYQRAGGGGARGAAGGAGARASGPDADDELGSSDDDAGDEDDDSEDGGSDIEDWN